MIKYVLVGIVFVCVVLGGLYVATEGVPQPTSTQTPQTQPVGEFDQQFKNLKIN